MELAMLETSVKSRKSAVRKRCGAGRPAASEVAERMESLLDVATAVFLKHGYEHASVSEIARRAGASKGTIYSHYPSKAELFVAVIARKMLKLQVSYTEILVSEISLKKVLERFGVLLVRGMLDPETRALFEVFVAVSFKFPKLSRNFWDVGPNRSMALLRGHLARHPEFRGKRPERAAEMFWSLCCGQLFLRRLLLEEAGMPEQTIRLRVKEATRIFLSAYT